MKDLQSFPDAELLSGYILEAAWFWFDASTQEKKVEVGLHRLVARCIYEEICRRGLDEAGPEQIYAHARRVFPPDDFYHRAARGYPYLLDTSPSPGW